MVTLVIDSSLVPRSRLWTQQAKSACCRLTAAGPRLAHALGIKAGTKTFDRIVNESSIVDTTALFAMIAAKDVLGRNNDTLAHRNLVKHIIAARLTGSWAGAINLLNNNHPPLAKYADRASLYEALKYRGPLAFTALREKLGTRKISLRGLPLGFNFRDVDLYSMDLSWSDFRGSRPFIGTNFLCADLYNADLRGVNLRYSTNLHTAKLSGALYSDKTSFPLGFSPLTAKMVLLADS